jgi:hypothetical protein
MCVCVCVRVCVCARASAEQEAWLRKVHIQKLLGNNGGREESVTGRAGGIGGGGGGGEGQAARRTDLQPLESMICGALAGIHLVKHVSS